MSSKNLLQTLKYCRYTLFPTSIGSVYTRQLLSYCSKTNSEHPFSNSNQTVENVQADCSQNAACEANQSAPIVKITAVFPKENLQKEIDARVGMSVMKAIIEHDSNLLPDSCGGQLCCSTCHCLVEEKDMHYFTPLNVDEEDLLDEFPNVKPNSRLSCQMKILKQFENVRIELISDMKE